MSDVSLVMKKIRNHRRFSRGHELLKAAQLVFVFILPRLLGGRFEQYYFQAFLLSCFCIDQRASLLHL